MDRNERWNELFKEISRLSKEPIGHPSFIFFFLIAILIVGGSGIWIEIVNLITKAEGTTLLTLRKTILSFFPILAASTCLQIVWEDKFKPIRSFIISLFVLTLVGLYFTTNSNICDTMAIKIGLISTAISLWMWWLANADQDFLKDPIVPGAALGNKDTNELLPGNLNGFKY